MHAASAQFRLTMNMASTGIRRSKVVYPVLLVCSRSATASISAGCVRACVGVGGGGWGVGGGGGVNGGNGQLAGGVFAGAVRCARAPASSAGPGTPTHHRPTARRCTSARTAGASSPAGAGAGPRRCGEQQQRQRGAAPAVRAVLAGGLPSRDCSSCSRSLPVESGSSAPPNGTPPPVLPRPPGRTCGTM